MKFPRAVLALGLVSLLMDMASEMLYPVGPIYLSAVLGASMAWVGLIEGLAEAVSGLAKGFFGALSDRHGRRGPFVSIGYGLSALSKPLPALIASVGGVLGARILDRIGKGVRTAPRDALLASYTTPQTRGAIFGLHRAMDTVGAALGPLIALAYLALNPGDYHGLFLIAFIPAALAALLTMRIKDVRFAPTAGPGPRASLQFWRTAPRNYRGMVLWLGLFAIVNSSDAFLILRARETGFSDTAAIGAYVAYNLIFALSAYPAGRLSDRFGRRRVLTAGLLLFSCAYALFALASAPAAIWIAFALYGGYAALTEGIAKAWIGDLVPNERRGLAIGLQIMVASLGALVASSWTGITWTVYGGAAPLLITAAVTLIAGAGLAIHGRNPRNVPAT